MFWNKNKIFFFIFRVQNIKSNCYIIFLKCFQIIIFWWKIYSFQLYLFIKGLIFVILCRSFFFFHNLTRLLQRIESSFYLFSWWDLFLLSCFLSSWENRYNIHHDWDLFYDIYNTLTTHSQRQNHCLSLILNYFDIYF